ncbi:group II intron reverse transcriptase/maturase [Candidatus Epulonipiscium fishelsonii]|uniref:Group II intron reverse transcriptase/maturase n=1 Tax=Candidatus Epulonipiscium fishelsonii TaxID=77094 RepID=A0ACC8XI15_9FIRM|nr:group II intron reverse transcriptase/maturase [Epulopiscium sp. SCG-D08WGA-EpuloA1]
MTVKQGKKQLLRNNEYYDIQQLYDDLYQKSKNNESFYNLMNLITSDKNIDLAYRNIKTNKGRTTPGTDGMTIDDLKTISKLELNRKIQNEFNNYNPKPVRRVEIPKPNGKTRPLGIPCIEDRLIQQCIKQVLEPIYEAKFHNHSYGFRPNRSTHHAIARTQYLINISKLYYCVDIDIKGFFDNINHSKLIKQLWNIGIKDKTLIKILIKILKSEVENIGRQNKGTPQGSIISPLLSNVVLNELDWWISDQWETFKTEHDYSTLNKKGQIDQSNKYRALKKSKMKEMYIVRYADDFKIFCRDYKSAQKIYIAVKQWLKERLKLDISDEKSKITNVRKGKTEFLGFKLWAIRKGNKIVCNSNMTDKAKKQVKENIKKQIKIIQKDRTAKQVNKLNSIILGAHNYYKIATHVNLDMAEIAYEVNRTFDNRLKLKKKEKIYRSILYEKLYGSYTNHRSILGIAIFPVHGCKTSPTMNFTQKICNYTENGRNLIHRKVDISSKLIQHMLNNINNDIIELSDNKISLAYGQRGLCGVTGNSLEIGKFECHHKKPKKLGGTDEYKNLILINAEVHKLIHATNETTIDKYVNEIKNKNKTDLNINKILEKVNTLRVKTGNFEIKYEVK